MHSKIFNYFSDTFRLFFYDKRLKRCAIMMYSLYTRLEWACVYTLIKCIIKFNMFVQKETVARAMVKVFLFKFKPLSYPGTKIMNKNSL